MQYTLRSSYGATMAELIVALAILSLGITALLQTLGGGIRFAKDTEDNIRAINIAREGIEAMINIRDTNWLRFSSDRVNCWKSKDYTSNCIGTSADPHGSKIEAGRYTVFPLNGTWRLNLISSPPNFVSNWSGYKSAFAVRMESSGFFTQTGSTITPCSSSQQKNCLTIFTREIRLTDVGTGTLFVESIVRWNLLRQKEVKLETTLTNWKSKF